MKAGRFLPAAFLLFGGLTIFRMVLAQDGGENGVLPPDQESVIHYMRSDDLADPITELKKKVEAGRVTLTHDATTGYLKSVLKELGVLSATQCLVFSKTSAQTSLISPKTPRAIYFSDDTYVAYVQGSDHLELSAVDPQKGAVFYELGQDPNGPPKIRRAEKCMRCHIGPKTFQVPGYLVRSSLTMADGTARSQITEFVSGHNSPLNQRWAGWYVTGKSAHDSHLGNSFLQDPLHPEAFDPKPGTDVMNLADRFDTTKYLRPTSDIVALMLLDDSVRMHDLLVYARYETLFAERDRAQGDFPPDWPEKRISRAGEVLLSYLLFRDETPLKGKLEGTSGIEKEFPLRGPRDRKGRSLRDFDLTTRMFKYPCNYLIYSKEFDALPDAMKQYLWKRLAEILGGKDQSPTYRSMSRADQARVREILLDTKPEFSAWCQKNNQ